MRTRKKVPWAAGAALLFAMSLAFNLTPQTTEKGSGLHDGAWSRMPRLSPGTEDDPNAQAEMEFLMTRDPGTNRIPDNIRALELEFSRRLPNRERLRTLNGGNTSAEFQSPTWTERGPDNVGGRTRVFAVDIANPATLIAGSVAGGLWKSVDDGGTWTLRTAPAQIHTTSCIAQDRRPGMTHIWYVGTGEFRGSTNNETRWGSNYRGDGIFKSTDNGSSWFLLPSTSPGNPQTADAFDYNWNIATDPSNIAEDEIYVAAFKGIYRSTDGGASWNPVLTADSSFTDVAVTPAGVVYAFTRNGGVTNIRRSVDGVSWVSIQPGTFPTSTGRVIIGLAPSNDNVVYFFAQGANNTPAIATHQLWKYTYLSGNGSGSGGTWENRGGNLPGDINTQTGYDMVVHIKPDDENFVLIGGTNLYRSTNGFTSTGATTTIGGYPYWPGGNHHPDLHSGAFKPGTPLIYYSGHDGGLSATTDITASSVAWTSLNNGYNVTQFYSVSIAPESGSDVIMGGTQDNGSVMGILPGMSSWTMVFGGDGTVVEVAPLEDDRLYTQYQGGQMQRHTRAVTSTVTMTPSGASNQLFVNPIVLDPNNSAILYYAAGRTSPALTSAVWRNDNAPNATTTSGWTALASTDVGPAAGYGRRITALGISTSNNPNVLYYGTLDGIVMRADNANTATPVVTAVTPPGLNGGTSMGGFVRCIAVDPANSNKALLTFGNYNFPSIWYTTDGGSTWTDVEGNLAGPAGPSVRFAAMFHVGGVLHMILATSIGVLSTTELNGASTVWIQEAATSIGNIITGYLDYRSSDKTLAVGTHARGIFTTQFEATSSIAVVGGWNVVSNPLNTDSDSVTVLFPSAISTAYRYDPLSGYQAASEMSNGLGYWLKFAVPEYISISGASSDSINIAVLPGWNLIGSVSEPVSTGAVLQNPPNNVTSLYYGYNGGYVQSDTIHPGKGYWVKVDQAGTLTLRSNASSMPPPDHDAHVKLLNMMSALTLTDASGCSQTLYFGEEPEWGSRPGLFELPPTPMDGIFDVRFASQRIAETYPSGFDREIEYRIAIWSAAYPLTISWKLSEIAPAAVLCTADGAGILWSDGPGISVVMKEESKVLVLRVSPSKPEPQEFRLAQNYPNPFNPRTEIRFSIPSTPGTLHATSLQIYDVVGREVATLVNDIRPPGSYEVTWDASGMPSGVYFCRLSVEPAASPYLASHRHNSQAGRFSEVRKLLLLK